MSAVLKPFTNAARSTLNVIRSVGSFLISQSDRASEAYAGHRARLASVDAARELLTEEGKALIEVKKRLLEKLVEAPSDERLRIRRDLDELSASSRQLNIGVKALEFLTETATHTEPDPPNKTPEIKQHWFDKFCELARAHNEPWREDLLARALAAEAKCPGTVSPQGLWLLGTMEEEMFHAFAIILDICFTLGVVYILPSFKDIYSLKIKSSFLDRKLTVSQLSFRLSNSGLIGDRYTHLRCRKGKPINLSYGKLCYRICPLTNDLKIEGVTLTKMGTTIASFYKRKQKALGEKLLRKFVESIDANEVSIGEVVMPLNPPHNIESVVEVREPSNLGK